MTRGDHWPPRKLASDHSAGNEFPVIEGDGKVGRLVELETSLADFVNRFAVIPGSVLREVHVLTEDLLIIRAPQLFDAAGHEHSDGASVWVEGSRIQAVYGREGPPEPANAKVLDFPDCCVLPGLMDSHTHMMYGTADRMTGPRSYDHVNATDSDALALLRSVRNGYRHLLRAGVTTMQDAGARNCHPL